MARRSLWRGSGPIETAGTISFVFIVLLFSGALAYAVFFKLRPAPRYDYFICHHKQDASAQARLVKMLTQSRCRCNVFIDSDDLTELDSLFDIVRCKLDHLVVYLTRDTLSRPWCAGEVTVAFHSGMVRVTAVHTSAFVEPTAEQLQDLDAFLDQTSCNLAEYHITNAAVAESISKLLGDDTDHTHLGEALDEGQNAGTKRFDDLVITVLNKSTPSLMAPSLSTMATSSTSTVKALPETSVVLISSLPGSDEAIATSYVIDSKIRSEVFSIASEGTCVLVNFAPELQGILQAVARARAVVAVLSPGSLESLQQLAAIVEGVSTATTTSASPPGIIPVTTPGFTFPDAGYYSQMLRQIWPRDIDVAVSRVQSFFKTIGVQFTTNVADRVLDIQALHVANRIPKNFDKAFAAMRTPQTSIRSIACEVGDKGREGSTISVGDEVRGTRL